VLLGHVAGRGGDAEVTIFKSLGMPVEDLAVAEFVYRTARQEGVGVLAEW
jgi:ornithine cyclodeaminase